LNENPSAYKPVPINWVGTFTNETGITLQIKDAPLSDNRLKFELVQQNPDCLESIKGNANLIKSDMATYTVHDTVIITLLYRTDQIDVSEIGYTHGASCTTFAGTYMRQMLK